MKAGLPLLILGALLTSCGAEDPSGSCCEGLPRSGLYATFKVGDERFQASITNPDGEAQARALWAGSSSAGIPDAPLLCSSVSWNPSWSWHLDPGNVEFAEVAIEACDGTPSAVEADCSAFGGRYCPWTAVLVDLRDCDAGPACPQVPR
jgi:hypothetical protein